MFEIVVCIALGGMIGLTLRLLQQINKLTETLQGFINWRTGRRIGGKEVIK